MMDPATLTLIEEGIQVGGEITLAIVRAIQSGKSREEALQEARSVIDRKLSIDNDVDVAAQGG